MHDRQGLLRRQTELSAKDLLMRESWQGTLALLAQAYPFAEAFDGMWDADTVADAEPLYASWRQRLPSELAAAFAPLTTAMPANLPIEQQDAEVRVDEIACLVDKMERLDLLAEAAKRESLLIEQAKERACDQRYTTREREGRNR